MPWVEIATQCCVLLCDMMLVCFCWRLSVMANADQDEREPTRATDDEEAGRAGNPTTTTEILLAQLPPTVYVHQEGSAAASTPCPICLADYKDQDAVRRLPCLHVFHATCLESWVDARRAVVCPVCRTSFDNNNDS